jgi:hypothetical protein
MWNMFEDVGDLACPPNASSLDQCPPIDNPLTSTIDMPLLPLWATAPEQVNSLNVEQILATAGDGKLRDETLCSHELRAYLSQVSSEKLAEYAEYCLGTSFEKSGFVLQDVVNELGRRLDFTVTNGRYQGTRTAVGHDGLWSAPENRDLVVEVKTTDAYRVSLDTIAEYRQQLLGGRSIRPDSSMLVVVGRQDTGELEAQVRGSRHAWDLRLISVDALAKLVRLKESTENPDTGKRIRGILVPVEYTRLDPLIEVLLSAAEDIETSVDAANSAPKGEEADASNWEFTDSTTIQVKRDQIVAAFAGKHHKKLIRTSRAVYWDADHSFRVVCTVSKRYSRRPSETYWYAYRQTWDRFLRDGKVGHFVLGGTDLQLAFAIPVHVLGDHLEELNTTEREDGTSYWHINIVERKPRSFALHLPKSGKQLDLAEYTFPLK